MEAVEFGDGLAGDLFLPDGDAAAPAVVLTGPLTAVKEQVSGEYAARLAKHGIVALAFDHRGWGASAGELRQHEDHGQKLRDLRQAVSFLRELDVVDPARIGMLGVSLGASYAIAAAAADPRVCSVAAVAGRYASPRALRLALGNQRYLDLLHTLVEKASGRGSGPRIPAFSLRDQALIPSAAMIGYFMGSQGRAPRWLNEITVESAWNVLTQDMMAAAANLGETPLLIVHGGRDSIAPPDWARELTTLHAGPSAAMWLDEAEHTDFFADDIVLTQVSERLAQWFRRSGGDSAGSEQLVDHPVS